MNKLQTDEKINIACTVDDNYVKYAIVMLASLFENNRDRNFNVFIVHNNLTKDKTIKVQAFFRKYKHKLNLLDITPFLSYLPINTPVTHHVTIATYFRLFLPVVLPLEIQKVLFLDPDIIIRKDIYPLWKIDITHYSHAAVLNPKSREYFATLTASPDKVDYFNAGVILINLHYWRTSNVLKQGCQIINQYSENLKFWDQDVLNILFKSKWLRISSTWNATYGIFMEDLNINELMPGEDLDNLRSDPAIVHFAGAGISKPWHYYCDRPFKDLYRKYLQHTPWHGSKLLDEPSLLMKLRVYLKLGSKIRQIVSFMR